MAEAAPDGMLIFVIAGEPSGDVLGGALMAALSRRSGGAIRFAGIGGPRMAEQGLRSLMPLHELAIMGMVEVLPRARRLLRRIRETADAIVAMQPAAVVTIDSSGFTWRVAKRLRERGVTMPLIHYVAPMVWVWRPENAAKIAALYDHLMTLLPFEPPYFTAVGLACTHVGHPIIESAAGSGDGVGFRARHGIAPDARLLCLLPGSRRGEVKHLVPVFRATVERLRRSLGEFRVVVPTLDLVAPMIGRAMHDWPVPLTIVGGDAKYDAFAASDVALAASGTVALELAMASLPAVITYRTNLITAWLARRYVKAPYANLINVVLDRMLVPELLLEDATPDRLSSAVAHLFDDAAARAAQVAGYREGLARLGQGGMSPSLRAADQVLAVIAARRDATVKQGDNR
ncbi:MAG: lpxB [Rhodospirillales bacterium]|nr:lpxB [Rhodospirillales bacterium]